MQWQKLYAACVSETETDRLEKLVYDTEGAMFLRYQELAYTFPLSNEVQELKQATTGLLEIRIKKLGWPDPFKVNAPNDGQELHSSVRTESKRASSYFRLAVPCPTCGAAAGKKCLLHSGGPRNDLHIDRKLSAIEAVEKQRMPPSRFNL